MDTFDIFLIAAAVVLLVIALYNLGYCKCEDDYEKDWDSVLSQEGDND